MSAAGPSSGRENRHDPLQRSPFESVGNVREKRSPAKNDEQRAVLQFSSVATSFRPNMVSSFENSIKFKLFIKIRLLK